MTALEFLQQAYMLDQQIQTKLQQISSLRSLAESMRSFTAKEPVCHTKHVTALEDAVIRIMGFLLGAVCGILNVWAISLVLKALVPVLGALFPQLFRAELFENSMLFNLIYEFNPFVYLGMDWLGL